MVDLVNFDSTFSIIHNRTEQKDFTGNVDEIRTRLEELRGTYRYYILDENSKTEYDADDWYALTQPEE